MSNWGDNKREGAGKKETDEEVRAMSNCQWGADECVSIAFFSQYTSTDTAYFTFNAYLACGSFTLPKYINCTSPEFPRTTKDTTTTDCLLVSGLTNGIRMFN
jgi:hypothetical protein